MRGALDMLKHHPTICAQAKQQTTQKTTRQSTSPPVDKHYETSAYCSTPSSADRRLFPGVCDTVGDTDTVGEGAAVLAATLDADDAATVSRYALVSARQDTQAGNVGSFAKS
eukprot:Opistho-2@90516